MKSKIIVGIAVVALVLSVLAIIRPKVVENIVQNTVGAIPGTSVDGTEFCIGGLCKLQAQIPFTLSTSTQCAIAITATSTLQSFYGNITTGTSTNALLVLATSSRRYAPPIAQATTSVIAQAIVPANTGGNPDGTGFAWYPQPNSRPGSTLVDATSTAQEVVLKSGEFLLLYSRGGGTSNDGQSGTVFSGRCSLEANRI